jgi:hypothetical protein
MKPIKTLHRGFDKLDIAIKGALSPNDIDKLELARVESERTHSYTLVKIGPGLVAMHVAESGLKGGYAFRGDTGPLGELWCFKRNLSGNEWNIRVSAKALSLATHGLQHVHNHIIETLARLGVNHHHFSIGRVDYAMDYLMPEEFKLDPADFISHSKSSRREHSGPNLSGSREDIVVEWAARRVKAVTIGKMPGQQLQVYDKRAEIIAHGVDEWFKLWKLDPADIAPHSIYRVEFRAGKKHLKDWNVRSFENLESKLGDIFARMMNDMRHVVPSAYEKNPSRWVLSRLWRQVCNDMKDGLAENFDGSVRGHIIGGSRETIFQQRKQQILDCVPGALIAKCLTIDGAYAKRGDFLRDLAKEMDRADRDKLVKKLQKAKDKLYFF